jgi:hypothetical protein
MDQPTCQQIYDEDLGDPVYRKDDASWRHGAYVTEVYHRTDDDTYWKVSYRLSTDGETNELREGIAQIAEVVPVTKTVIEYVRKAE